MQRDDERFGSPKAPSFVKDAAEGIAAAKKAEAERAEADQIEAERQRAADEKVRLAKEAAEELAQYSGLELEVRIKAKAKELGISKKALAREVTLLREGYAAADAMTVLPEVEPWPEPVDGDDVLDQLVEAFRKYIVMESDGLHVLALWAVHTYCFERWQNSPRLYLSSPKKRSGKSRVLDVLDCVVSRPIRADGLSAAVVFRLTADSAPTWLVDETDQWLDQRGELIGILNSGHAKGQKVYRCVGDEHRVQEFSVFAPVALAGIGKIKSDTLADRSIVVTIRRRLKSESVQRFRRNLAEKEFEPLCRQIARWVADWTSEGEPEIPAAVDHDRMVDNWWPLLAIADAAGGEWPERARGIMLRQFRAYDSAEDDGWDSLLLKDIKDIFDQQDKDRLLTKTILDKLHLLGERPWPEFPNKRGPAKPITDRQVARLLEPHDIKPRLIRFSSTETGRGYERAHFEETWRRYIDSGNTPLQSVTPLQPADNGDESCNAQNARNVTDNLSVTENPKESAQCNGVTDKPPPTPRSPSLEVTIAAATESAEQGPDVDPFDIPIPDPFRRA